jgi:cell division septal protein FtsQ
VGVRETQRARRSGAAAVKVPLEERAATARRARQGEDWTQMLACWFPVLLSLMWMLAGWMWIIETWSLLRARWM